MIQCSYQITQFLLKINRQVGERKKGMQVLLVEEREIKLLVDLNKKKKELLFLSFDDSLHTDKKESSDVTSF
jgi:hypothetical protein